VVLKNLQVSDYVHFTMLCRKFNEFFWFGKEDSEKIQ
jgi:hypothetical protein